MNRFLCRIAGIALTAAISIAAIGTVPAAAQNEVSITVNGEQVQFEEQPFIMNDCTMVPYNTIADALKVIIQWDKVNQNAKVYYRNRDVLICTLYRHEGYAELSNGERIELEAPPTVADGRAFVPLRALCDILGFPVQWNAEQHSVNVDAGLLEYYEEEFHAENDTNVSVLEDRLQMMLPSDTEKKDIYEGESLIVTRGDTCVTLDFSEDYIISVGNLRKDAENMEYDIEDDNAIVRDDEFEVLRVTPKTTHEDKNKWYNLTEFYLIKNTDGYLLSLSAQISSDSKHNMGLAEAWLDDAVTGIRSGGRKIDTKARTYELNGLSISVPDGYIAMQTSPQYGGYRDWHILKPAVSGEYADNAHIWLDYHKCADGTLTSHGNGTFLGLPVFWDTDGPPGTWLSCVDNAQFSVLINVNSEEGDALKAICENIKGDPYALSEQMLEEIRKEKNDKSN